MEVVSRVFMVMRAKKEVYNYSLLGIKSFFILSYVIIISEFCGEDNHDVDVTIESITRSDVCDYLLEPVEKEEAEAKPNNEKEDDTKAEAKKKGKASTRSSLVIFAIDISGSMSSTTTVPDLQGLSADSIGPYIHIIIIVPSSFNSRMECCRRKKSGS